MPSDQALTQFPEIVLPENLAVYLTRGQSIRSEVSKGLTANELIRMYTQGGVFLGLGALSDEGKIIPKRMFVAQH